MLASEPYWLRMKGHFPQHPLSYGPFPNASRNPRNGTCRQIARFYNQLAGAWYL